MPLVPESVPGWQVPIQCPLRRPCGRCSQSATAGPVAVQSGLLGGWRHRCPLLPPVSPGMSELQAFLPEGGCLGPCSLQFPVRQGTNHPVPPHLLDAGTLPWEQAFHRLPGGPSTMGLGLWGRLHSPRQRAPTTQPTTAVVSLTAFPSLQSFQGSQGPAYSFNQCEYL